MKNNLKSALAFFFLFFLHGISIGNGQQGISYNGSRLCEAVDFEKLNFNLKQKIKWKTKAQN
jgi:hypothetical protein